jgi:hypothetical protein
MSEADAAAFDREVRELVLSHTRDGLVCAPVQTSVVWGAPAAGSGERAAR